MSPARILAIVSLMALLIGFGGTATAELTLETSEKPGELYFLWQDRLTSSGAQSHRLSEMRAFSPAYSKALVDQIEILEVRELDTDQELRFNYVLTKQPVPSPKLQDVIWYYPNPIPSGGRVRVQLRGRIVAPKVFRQSPNLVEVDFESGEGAFIVLPLGYAITYGNSPIIVYEKNARTVCSFSQREISLKAKNAVALAATKSSPTISRELQTKANVSRIPIQVKAVDDERVLTIARQRLSGSTPVWYVSHDQSVRVPAEKLRPMKTLIWRIGPTLLKGEAEFARISSFSEIGSEIEVAIAQVDEKGQVGSIETVRVPVLSGEK